nr:V-type ATP synthase subunit E [uncultured Sellimonas sp.]
MTLEEKIARIQTSSMEAARSEGNEIIESYRAALDKVFEDHKQEALRQVETRVKAETVNARQQKNQAMAKAQLDLKRQEGRVQKELKDKVFQEVMELVEHYMKTEEYQEFLLRCIEKSVEFAGGEELTIYINPSDQEMKEELELKSGTMLTISREDFIGGIRAVIRGRNVLIDHSFRTALRTEYDEFVFQGGDGVA